MSGIRAQTTGVDRDGQEPLPEGDRIFTIHQAQSVMFLNGPGCSDDEDHAGPDMRLPVPHQYSA